MAGPEAAVMPMIVVPVAALGKCCPGNGRPACDPPAPASVGAVGVAEGCGATAWEWTAWAAWAAYKLARAAVFSDGGC